MFKKLVIALFIVGMLIGNLLGQESQSDYFRKTDLKIKPIVSWDYKFFKPFEMAMIVIRFSRPNNSNYLFYAVASNQSHKECNKSVVAEFIEKWSAKYASSKVVEVQRIPQQNVGLEGDFFSYGWILNGDKNFAIELVRQGGCEAKAMLVKKEEENQILVKEEIYEEFKKKIFEAESLAKKKKIGIWKNQIK